MKACGYIGPAPIPLADYVLSVEAQTIRAEAPRRDAVGKGFCRYFHRSRPVREFGAGRQFGGGHVSLRRARQRQIDARPADHGLLRPAYLGSANADRRRPTHQALRFRLSRGGQGRQKEHLEKRGARPALDENPPAHGGRRRRIDDGQPRTAPRSAQQRQRSSVANEEQLRLPVDRRFRPAADRTDGLAEPLDHSAWKIATIS